MTEKKQPGAPAPQVEMWPVEKLLPYARNSRTHSESQVEQIAGSLVEFGWTAPVLHDGDGGILAGHGRVLGANKVWAAGREIPNVPHGMVPVISLAHLSPAQRKAYIIADNRLSDLSGWDNAMLAAEFRDLQALEYPLDLIGYEADEVEDVLELAGYIDGHGPVDSDAEDDDAPEPPTDPVSKPGDMWLLGRHRIICGSSTDAHTVERVLGGAVPHLMVTDPPYGVEYDANWRNEAARSCKGMGNRSLGAGAVGKVLNDDIADWREAWALFPGHVAYVWHAGLFAGVVADSLTACDFALRSQIIWAKSNFAISRGDYHWQHEPCWYAVRKGKTGHYEGDRKQTTLWAIPKPAKSETGHSTQKPVDCMRIPILNNSKTGDAVYEPFSGSGTTIIAAESTGRTCYAVELNPAYVDVAIKRWQTLTGGTAVLDGDGRQFDALLAEKVG